MKSMEILSHGVVCIGKERYKPLFLLLSLQVHQNIHPLIN
jgi:hypothetical protein